MTVRELYDYAISHSPPDHHVQDVLALCYNKHTSLNPPTQSNNSSHNDRLNKVEWSIEDVLWLFST